MSFGGAMNALGAAAQGANSVAGNRDALREYILRFIALATGAAGGARGTTSPLMGGLGALAGLANANSGITTSAPAAATPAGAAGAPLGPTQGPGIPGITLPNQEWRQEGILPGDAGIAALGAMPTPGMTPEPPGAFAEVAPPASLPTTVASNQTSADIMSNPTPDRQPGANPPGQPTGAGNVMARGGAGGESNEIIENAINQDPGRAFSLAYGGTAPMRNSILQQQIGTYEPRLNDIEAIMGMLGGGVEPDRVQLAQQLVRGRGEVSVGGLLQQILARAQGGDEEAIQLLTNMGGPTGEGLLSLVALSDRQKGRNPALARVRQQRASAQMNDNYNTWLRGNPTEDQNPMSSWASILASLG